MNKKIAFYIANLNSGGIGRNTLRIADELKNQGYQVDLVVTKLKGVYVEDVPSDLNVVDLKSRRVLTSIFKLISYLKNEQPNIFISANNLPNIISILSKILSKSKVKMIISIRTHLSSQFNHHNTLKNKIIMYLAKLFYPKSDVIVAVSKGVAEDAVKLINLDKDKIKVIYNPIVSDDINVKKDKKITETWFDLEKTPVIISAGRLTKQKDYYTLIDAFKILRSKRMIKLIILGEGEEKEKIWNYIKINHLEDDIKLKGFVNNPYPYIKKSNVFVLSSQWEGFGNVVAESLAVGTPIVSTDCPSGPAEILDFGNFGKLVPVGNSQKMADSIESILLSSVNHKKLIQRSKVFSVANAANEYEKLWI